MWGARIKVPVEFLLNKSPAASTLVTLNVTDQCKMVTVPGNKCLAADDQFRRSGEKEVVAEETAEKMENEVSKEELVEGLMMKEQDAPIIFGDDEYRIRRQEYNPVADAIPHDFFRFGPTELETPLREFLHADDQWGYVPEKSGEPLELPQLKTEEESGIGRAISSH